MLWNGYKLISLLCTVIVIYLWSVVRCVSDRPIVELERRVELGVEVTHVVSWNLQ